MSYYRVSQKMYKMKTRTFNILYVIRRNSFIARSILLLPLETYVILVLDCQQLGLRTFISKNKNGSFFSVRVLVSLEFVLKM